MDSSFPTRSAAVGTDAVLLRIQTEDPKICLETHVRKVSLKIFASGGPYCGNGL